MERNKMGKGAVSNLNIFVKNRNLINHVFQNGWTNEKLRICAN